MTLLVQSLEPAVFDLGVELRGGDAGVPQQFLQLTDARSTGKHVGSETVAERVRADVAGDARAGG